MTIPPSGAALLAAALALTVQALGCSPRAAPTPVEPVHLAEPPPAATTAVAAATAQPLPPLDEHDLAQRVRKAYLARAGGSVDEARAMFADVVRRLVQAGERPVAGLGAAEGYAVKGRTASGLTTHAGTLFFDPDTGEPFAFSDVALRREGPIVDAPFFVTEPLGLHDPTAGRELLQSGELIAVHPDGHRAYVLDERCRLQEWNIAEARVARALGAHRPPLVAAGPVPEECAACACEIEGFRSAVITADGRWIVSQWGRWNLASGAFFRLPIPWTWQGFQPALSPDGRYVATIRDNPKAPPSAMVGKNFLVVYDMERGAPLGPPKALPSLSNSTPLSFGTNPLRVCVFDYGQRAFAVPSMALIAAWATGEAVGAKHEERSAPDALLDCAPKAAPAPPSRAELTLRLAQRVCSFGRFLLPREYCERAP